MVRISPRNYNIFTENSRLQDDAGDIFLKGDAEKKKIPLFKQPTKKEKNTAMKRPKHTFTARRGYEWIKTEDKSWLGAKRKYIWTEVKIKKR